MNRRDFLKNSVGGLLLALFNTNSIAKIISESKFEDIDVLFYLIQNKNGEWKVKGTIWKDVAKQKLSAYHYNLDTFRPLKVVSNSNANQTKKYYWKKYNCDGRCITINYLQSYKNGIKSKKSGQLQSICGLGGKKTLGSGNYKYIQSMGGKIIGNINVTSGHLKSVCSDGGKAGAKVQMENGLGIHIDKETRTEWARLGGLAVIGTLNRERECPYCGIKTKGAAYNRWHGKNCKHKPYLD